MAKKQDYNEVLLGVLEPKPRKAEEVKAKIIEATIRVINEQGIENASFDNIGKEVSMKRPHIAYYFKSREMLIDLVLVYINRMAQSITLEMVEKASGPTEKLEAMLRAAFRWAMDYPHHVAAYLVYYSMCARLEEYQTSFRETRRLGVERLHKFMTEIQPKKGRELLPLASAIQGIVLGCIFEALAKGQLTDKKFMAKQEDYTVILVMKLLDDV